MHNPDTIYLSKILIHAYLRTQTTSLSGCQGQAQEMRKVRGKKQNRTKKGALHRMIILVKHNSRSILNSTLYTKDQK